MHSPGACSLKGRQTWKVASTLRFRVALARKPDKQEMQVVKTRHRLLLERYRKDTEAAAKVVGAVKKMGPRKLDAAEHAAWTGLANLILNLDETLTRE